MIKLICPKCMKPVPIAEDFTGREATCPACGTVFPVPSRYMPEVLPDPASAAVAPTRLDSPSPEAGGLTSSARPEPPGIPSRPESPPAPPPGYVPPMLTPPTPPPIPASASSALVPVPPPTIPGYTKSLGITISPHIVAWLPAVLLTITFLCTFFPWVGSYLGGYPVHSQGPWRAVGGWVSRNYKLEQKVPEWHDKVPSDWGLMVPFLFLLVAALALAWADRGVETIDTRRWPQFAKAWPWRKAIIGGLAGLALFVMLIQLMNGFGMERAIRKMVHDDPVLVQERDAAKNSPSPIAAQATVENKEEAKLAEYNLERTWWQDLGLACNLLAVVAAFLSIRLDQRGNRPPPRLVLHY